MDEQSGGNSPDAAKAAGGDALLTLVTNGKKQNAVDAGLVTKTSDKALASVTSKGGTGAGALAATKGSGRTGAGAPAATKGSGRTGAGTIAATKGSGRTCAGTIAAHEGAGGIAGAGIGIKNSAAGAALAAGKKGAGVTAGVAGKGAGALATTKAAKSASSAALAAGKKGAGKGAADAAEAALDAAAGKSPMKKRILSAAGVGAASGAEASLYVDSDDIGAQAAEELRSGTVTGAKGALRARKFMRNRKVKVGHAARNAEKTARKAKGASSLVSNGGKGQVKKIAGRSAAKKTAQMQTALKARQAAMVAKAATSKGAMAVVYKIVAVIISAVASALPIIAAFLSILSIIILIAVFIATIVSFFTGFFDWFSPKKASYGGLTGNEREVVQFFDEQGLNTFQIAGIMANLKAECGDFDPRHCQDGEYYDNYPEEYINIGTMGYGICQWSAAGRSQALVNYAAEQGKSSGDLTVQLEYLWIELNGDYQKNVLDPILAATSAEEVCIIWGQNFEVFAGSGDTSGEEFTRRLGYAQEYLERLTSGSASDLVSWARSRVGLDYHFGAQGQCLYGSSAEEYDCSGLVDQALTECGYGDFGSIGSHGPNTEGLLSYARAHWDEIDVSDIKDGDIAFFIDGDGGCYHVAITTDGGGLIEAAGRGVHDVKIRECGMWYGAGGNRFFRPKAA